MKKVRQTDCRDLKHDELTLLRKRAVQAVQAGESPEVVSKAFGINRTTIYDWLAAYCRGGWHALEARKCMVCIYFGDEAGVRSDYHSGVTWAYVEPL